jgi:hypothetical protein
MCPNVVTDSPYCPAHAGDDKEKSRERYRQDEWTRKICAPTFVKLSKLLKGANPTCQKLEHGVQCTNVSQITHHMHGRGRPDLFFSVYDKEGKSSLVALCRVHHPSSDGTMHWIEGKDFVRTRWTLTPTFAKG